MIVESILADGVPEGALDHFDRGWEAVSAGDSRTAYTHFILAMRAAPRGKTYREPVVLANLMGLDCGEFQKWKDRWRAISEAARLGWSTQEWLWISATAASDLAVIKGAPGQARQQLWSEAAGHSETSYGIASLLTEIGASNLRKFRLRYERLLRESLTSLSSCLAVDLQQLEPDHDTAVTMILAKDLLQQLSVLNTAKTEAIQLCETLLTAPDEFWLEAQDEDRLSPIDHRREIEVRSEQIRTQRSSGCCLYGLFYVIVPVLGLGLAGTSVAVNHARGWMT